MTTYRLAAAALWLSTTGLRWRVNLVRPALAADPLGNWYTADNDSQVRIINCGGALCGKLVWLKVPIDPATGQPKLDKNNADASKQSRPLLGVPIVLGMKPSGPDQWSGNVYNASDGKTYSGSFTMTGDNYRRSQGLRHEHHLQIANLDAGKIGSRLPRPLPEQHRAHFRVAHVDCRRPPRYGWRKRA